MKLETEEPTRRAVAPLGYTFEYLVDMNALVPANAQRGAVHKTDAGTFASKNLLDEQCQGKSHLSLKLNKSIVRDSLCELMAEVFADFIQIEMLQAKVV